MASKQDKETDYFLSLNGERFFIDEKGNLEVIFKVRKVERTTEIPQGFKYSLVLINRKRG